jgi:hypothetical protein
MEDGEVLLGSCDEAGGTESRCEMAARRKMPREAVEGEQDEVSWLLMASLVVCLSYP